MQLFELTRALIDTESITGNEERVGLQLLDHCSALAARYGGYAERSEVEPHRANVFACWGDRPTVALSTHMDTVPPFIPSREDGEHIWGRGLRHQGHHRRHAQGGRGAARKRHAQRTADGNIGRLARSRARRVMAAQAQFMVEPRKAPKSAAKPGGNPADLAKLQRQDSIKNWVATAGRASQRRLRRDHAGKPHGEVLGGKSLSTNTNRKRPSARKTAGFVGFSSHRNPVC